MKQCPEYLCIFSIETITKEKNVELKSSKSMLIKTGYPNLLHDRDFLDELLMSLRRYSENPH